jgi:lactate racemase
MANKDVIVDFGAEQATISVPESAVVAPFAELVKPGMSVAIAFDDPTRPPAPWQLILPELVARLLAGGVRREDITFICANGTHKKWTHDELRNFLGAELFDAFWPNAQIRNHDCLDAADLIDLGRTASGCAVEHNRTFINADLMIYVGQVMAHSWGGYTGTGAVIGLASTRSILSHHNHGVVNHPETTTGDHKRMYFRKLKAEINAHIEQTTAKRIFYINWVGGVAGQMTDIVAGYSPEVEAPAWDAADAHSRVSVPQADILVVGMPASFAYGSANNPLIAAIGMAYPVSMCCAKVVWSSGCTRQTARLTRRLTLRTERSLIYTTNTTQFMNWRAIRMRSPAAPTISPSTATVMLFTRFIRFSCSIPATTFSRERAR